MFFKYYEPSWNLFAFDTSLENIIWPDNNGCQIPDYSFQKFFWRWNFFFIFRRLRTFHINADPFFICLPSNRVVRFLIGLNYKTKDNVEDKEMYCSWNISLIFRDFYKKVIKNVIMALIVLVTSTTKSKAQDLVLELIKKFVFFVGNCGEFWTWKLLLFSLHVRGQ